MLNITAPIHLFHHLRSRLNDEDPVEGVYDFVEVDTDIVRSFERTGRWRAEQSLGKFSSFAFCAAFPGVQPELPNLNFPNGCRLGRGLMDAWMVLLDLAISRGDVSDVGLADAIDILIIHLGWQRHFKVRSQDGRTRIRTRKPAVAALALTVDVAVPASHHYR